MSAQLIYYVYAYVNEDGTPYYIGKGKGRRAYVKHCNVETPSKNRIVFLETNLTEIGAWALERRMITWFGRLSFGDGILQNKSIGGPWTGSDGQRTIVSRRKVSKSLKLYKRTAEHSLNISKSRLGKVACLNINTNEKLVVSKKEFEDNTHLVGIVSGHSNPWTDERRKKQSEKTKGVPKPWAKNNFAEQKRKIAAGELINPSLKVWEVTHPCGKIETIINMSEFCKKHNLSFGNLSSTGRTKGYTVVCLGRYVDIKNLELTQASFSVASQ